MSFWRGTYFGWWFLLLGIGVPCGFVWAQDTTYVESQEGLYALQMRVPGLMFSSGLPVWPLLWAPRGYMPHWEGTYPENFLLWNVLTGQPEWEYVPGEWLHQGALHPPAAEPRTEIRYGIGQLRWQYVSVRYMMSRPFRWGKQGVVDFDVFYRGYRVADPYTAMQSVGKQWYGSVTYRRGSRRLRIANWNMLLRGGARGRIIEPTARRILQPDAWKKHQGNILRLELTDSLASRGRVHLEGFQRNTHARYQPVRTFTREVRAVERGGKVVVTRTYRAFHLQMTGYLQDGHAQGAPDTLSWRRRLWGVELKVRREQERAVQGASLGMEHDAGYWLPQLKLTYEKTLGETWKAQWAVHYRSRLPSLLARNGWPGVLQKLDTLQRGVLLLATMRLKGKAPEASWEVEGFIHETRREEIWQVQPAQETQEADSFRVTRVPQARWLGMALRWDWHVNQPEGFSGRQRVLVLWPLQVPRALRHAWPGLSGILELGYRKAYFQHDLRVEALVRARGWLAYAGWFLNQEWGTFALPEDGATFISTGGTVDVVIKAHLRTAILQLTLENAAGRWLPVRQALIPGYPLPESWVRLGIFWPLNG